jgi:hypothetical protein
VRLNNLDVTTADLHLEIVATIAAGVGALIPIVLGALLEFRNAQIRSLGPFQQYQLGKGLQANRRAEKKMLKHYREATRIIVFSTTFTWVGGKSYGWFGKRGMWDIVCELSKQQAINCIYPKNKFNMKEFLITLKKANRDYESANLESCFICSEKQLHLSYIEKGRNTSEPKKLIMYRYLDDESGDNVCLVTVKSTMETKEFFSIIEEFVLTQAKNVPTAPA